MIYLDNAATSYYKPEEVINAVCEAMKTMGNAGRGANDASLSSARKIYETREKICDFFNGESSKQVVFTSNATEALNMAINGLFSEKSHIITTEAEHNSVLRPLYLLEKKGTSITFLKSHEIENPDISFMQKYIRKNTEAVICTHASNLTGNITDIKKIGEFCRRNNLLFIVDASQTAGIIPIDIISDNIDVLCFTGHKGLMGLQGTGGLYVKKGININPMKVGGSGIDTYNKNHPVSMPERLEAGTLNGHGIAGLNAAIDFINKTGIQNIHKKESELMWKFYDGIKNIKNIKIYGTFFNRQNEKINRIPLISINIGDIDSGEICDILNVEYNIVTRAGGHCAPLMHKALGTERQGAVRFSFSYFNSENDVKNTVNALKEIVSYYK
ncbi:aminotransferase class V-fold PLP-dependent enzyme [Leptotrichia sp. OH3620_COT-345]|uniref:aminotransferase class V-fold PLP-dependent enzyme n=1 Tax=Leptotrichia sp. OH3620_COT-345 TaxID=2491048 RepID=UPI000F64D3A2|nr:aminotransferase class V-fold PLP-dependent enzyme [Leptotrichia sp. OH3620_COT-345]RRD40672.1 aminotransferase class V-fold PLP-dependent enzyme [Leptotrichia sp. OH3620_COT-345]